MESTDKALALVHRARASDELVSDDAWAAETAPGSSDNLGISEMSGEDGDVQDMPQVQGVLDHQGTEVRDEHKQGSLPAPFREMATKKEISNPLCENCRARGAPKACIPCHKRYHNVCGHECDPPSSVPSPIPGSGPSTAPNTGAPLSAKLLQCNPCAARKKKWGTVCLQTMPS
uniref:Uncharacterized protein n=1 Tax=Eutreptiella gymnastica TaxID=73025 RepID=A0A7S1N1D0_9EUGL|mmetsp:Transcript_102481/g.176961  ORF Transcript_102481/g.176961 Transcript_102481/m.176961 type:complete len:174 (+) Transcript_102481:1231-1752(+)